MSQQAIISVKQEYDQFPHLHYFQAWMFSPRMQADEKEAHCTDAGQPLSEQPDKVLDEIPDQSS